MGAVAGFVGELGAFEGAEFFHELAAGGLQVDEVNVFFQGDGLHGGGIGGQRAGRGWGIGDFALGVEGSGGPWG